ncbi:MULTISPECIES: hypothetical protein [Pseudomonas]|uniref:Uncharacterized protein n=1 Tax=Pseudomonas fluorescens TaxID=294 RepID=A0A166QLJ5_PSEFL|nr:MULTISPECIES: hypothetical protein [Pseudomonas]KZN20474.1 hypothetical protein A1D17_02725 [Pseudomonas fluorescens]
MNTGLTEDDIRRALGLDVPTVPHSSPAEQKPPAAALKPASEARPASKAKVRTPKLRVTLRVSKEFEGESELFIHDAATLSQFDAEQEAKTLAKKAKYRFFDKVSITTVE